MISAHRAAWEPGRGVFGKVQRYLDGHHDLPYMPRGATVEYRDMARRSITNWLPLVSDTFSKVLFVEGYRSPNSKDNEAAWRHWQANKLDARQTIAHRAALDYGVGYVEVLPSDSDSPSIKPLHPSRVWAEYEDEDDEYPHRYLVRRGKDEDGNTLYRLVDDTNSWDITAPQTGAVTVGEAEAHKMPVPPLIRFRERLDVPAHGIIRPLIRIQDQINETRFMLAMGLQYASFRQRWATGLVVPRKDDGTPIEPFEAAVNRLWVTDNSDAKFGDFAQTQTQDHLNAYESGVKTMAAIGQLSPHVFAGDLVNLSADALAAVEASTDRKIDQYAMLFGENWEQVLTLAAIAAGDPEPDASAQVRWRDSESRSFAQTVDGIVKLIQGASVPAEAMWPRIPGVTDTDITEWKAMAAANQDGMTALAAAIDRQAASTTAPAAPPAQPPAA
nr:phage portal protein [Kribbella sandramycini]